MRRTPPAFAAAAVAVAVALTLAACSPSGGASTAAPGSTDAASGPCVPAGSGSVSESIGVTGAFDATPVVSIPSPVTATVTQRTVVTTGTGAELNPGTIASVDLTLYNGTTGAALTTTGHGTGTPLLVNLVDGQLKPGLLKALDCSTVGSRVVGVLAPVDMFGSAGQSSLGVGPTDTLVVVADVMAIVPSKADGADQPAQDGFPTVALAANGTPTVTLPTSAPPTTTQIALLKKGTGAVVGTGDTVVLQYQGLIWGSGKKFTDTWGSGPQSNTSNGYIPGFSKAIIGQTVGSQVIVIIPPADGYGSAGNSNAGIAGTDTIVFVIDILADTPKVG